MSAVFCARASKNLRSDLGPVRDDGVGGPSCRRFLVKIMTRTKSLCQPPDPNSGPYPSQVPDNVQFRRGIVHYYKLCFADVVVSTVDIKVWPTLLSRERALSGFNLFSREAPKMLVVRPFLLAREKKITNFTFRPIWLEPLAFSWQAGPKMVIFGPKCGYRICPQVSNSAQ